MDENKLKRPGYKMHGLIELKEEDIEEANETDTDWINPRLRNEREIQIK